jgi:DivIVA domain-containing protein
MTTSEEPDHEDWTGRLSPTDVHHVVFSRVGLGRRGYDEIEVDVFLERVEQELSRLIVEKADLRDEVSRLRSQPTPGGATAPVTDGAIALEEAQRQAVRLLAAAQQTADAYVADAETYSRRL